LVKGGRMPLSQQMITILIADDHPTTIQGVRFILEKVPDMKIVGEVQDGSQIKQAVERIRPNVLLLDLKMPNHSPSMLERWVRENYPDIVTLIFTAHDRDAYLSNMMETGVAGYLDKKLRAGQLVSAIRRAARGEILFEPEQFERVRRWRDDVRAKWESLSEREREVLQMLTEGADNKVIAISLKITANTVEKHLSNIYKKLGVASRTEAVIWWLEKGGDFRN
jgi:two-component system, NarL family, response regulator LiaR